MIRSELLESCVSSYTKRLMTGQLIILDAGTYVAASQISLEVEDLHINRDGYTDITVASTYLALKHHECIVPRTHIHGHIVCR